MAAPIPGSLVITDFSRGWDPTHPDEQLVGANLAPGAQFSAAVGAPFKSPDVHDVDFWNGFLNKRNGKSSLGLPIGSAMLGLYMYFYTSTAGAVVRQLVSFANAQFNTWNGLTWSPMTLNWANVTYAYFSTLKNLLFVSNGASAGHLYPNRWWDGSSTNIAYHGARMSPFYNLYFGGNYSSAGIATFSATAITCLPNQGASGLFRGKKVWLHNTVAATMEPAVIANFTTSGSQGAANYYVLTITLLNLPKYATSSYDLVTWNGSTITSSSSGGSITTASKATCIRILAVTTFLSGGQRASEWSIDVPTGSTGSISLSNLNMAFGDGQLFGTDIANNATTWYMTLPFDPTLAPATANSGPSQIFYRIPDNQGTATDTSTGYNPMPNATTSFNILTNRNANTDASLIADTAADAQGYFTGQVDVPFYKISISWANFLVLIGDIWNPSSIWISAYGAPQVFGTQGGLDGAFIQIPNGNDGQVIIGAYVWRGDLYIFKTNSVYVVTFTGNTSLSPFVVTKLQGNYGPVSPGSIQEGDSYLYFLSPLGLCAISGLTVALLPESDDIRAKFSGSNTWNLSLMGNALSINFPLKKQIWFQVAVKSAGDQVLVYDLNRRNFLYHTGAIQESAYLQDLSSSPPAPYAGDSNGQLYQLDIPGTDEATPIDMRYETPWLNLGDPTAWKEVKWIWLAGAQQQSGTMFLEVYVDYQLKAYRVLKFDMTDPRFSFAGVMQNLNSRNKYYKFVLTNNDSGVPVAIRYLRIDYVNLGVQL